MCSFLAALVTKKSDVLCKPEVTDSHEDLIEHFNLRDDNLYIQQRFVRVEFHPGGASLHELDKYVLYLDEREAPDWWEDVREKAERKLRIRSKEMIVSNEKPILLGGCYILHGDAKIRNVQGSRIVSMRGNASVSDVSGNASVSDVRGNASVSDVSGNAKIINAKRKKK